jgi:hypothetical protein
MFRYLQVDKDKPIAILTSSESLATGAVVAKDYEGNVGKANAVAGEFFVDVPKDYTGLNAVYNPTDAGSTEIAQGNLCQVVPTKVGERYATSEATPNYADIGDPMTAVTGKMQKAASEASYQWIYGGTYNDPTGTLYIVEKVAPSTAAATRTMTYDANGGTGTQVDPRSPYYVGKNIAVMPCGFTAPAYKDFVEWDTAAGGTGTAYDPGDEITVAAANIKLYAQYADTHTKLALNANGGTGTMTDNTKYYVDEVISIPESTFTPAAGKKFSKWNTAAAGTGTNYAPEDEITVTEAMIGAATTLYAIWVDA